MSLTLAVPIATARGILNDPDAVRFSAVDLLSYANDALDQLVTLAPQLFLTEGEVTCVAGKTMQTLDFAGTQALVSVRRVKNGKAITPADRATLDAFLPTWHTVASAAAIHWSLVEGDPRRFLIYPPAPVGQVLDVTFIRIPEEYGVGIDTGIPNTYSDAVADYIVYRAESRDDEHVNTGRAAQFLASFVSKIKGV